MAACECGIRRATHTDKLPRYEKNGLVGLSVVLLNSVEERVCGNCGGRTVVIPDPDGLLCAVAAARVKVPIKLQGKEIKFLRKALDRNAKELSEILQVSPETFSRWENEKEPIGVANEKILRLLVAWFMRDKAPAVQFTYDEIIKMKIQGVRLAGEEVVMCFTYSQFREKQAKAEDWLWEEKELEAA